MLVVAYGIASAGTFVLAEVTHSSPQVVPGLNTALLIILAVVQNRHYRRSADAEYRAFKVERRLRRIERKLGMGRREGDDHKTDTDDDEGEDY